MPTPEQKAYFESLCKSAMLAHPSADGGIGTLGEKRMHAIIKSYLCADPQTHEVKLEGTRFVSDVRIGNHVFEVQTGSFFPMKKKIDYYLQKTDCRVTVVHPVPALRWMSWVDPETMEIQPRKRVYRVHRPVELLPELASLAPHLQNPRLDFRLLLLETYDFRLLDGYSPSRKKRATHYERIPLSLLDELCFSSPADFCTLLPPSLPPHFTAKQLATAAKLQSRDAYAAVRALAALGLILPAEPIGKAAGWLQVFPESTHL